MWPDAWRTSGDVSCEAVVIDRTDHSPTATLTVLDGSIDMDATRDVRWTASLTVTGHTAEGEPMLPLRVGSLAHPVTDAWIRLTVTRGGQRVPAGVYLIDQATPQGADTIQLNLVDLTRALYVQDAYQATAGFLPVADAIRFLLADSAGYVQWAVDDGTDTDLVPADGLIVASPGDDPWPKVVKLATGYGRDAAMNRHGIITVTALRNPGPAVAQIIEGEDCTVRDLSVSARRGEYRNAVTIPTTQSLNTEYRGTLVQTHPGDPYAYPGVPLAPLAPDLMFTTEWQAAAAHAARTLLPRVVAANDPVLATGLPMPWLEPDDVVDVHAPSRGIYGPHWVRGWTCPVGPGQGTVRLHPVREVLAGYGS